MLVVIVELARHSLVDVATVTLAGGAFAALRLTKLDVLLVVAGGALLYMFLNALFV